MVIPFKNEKTPEETLLKIAKMRFYPSRSVPVMSCYDKLAMFLHDPDVKGSDRILLLGSPHKGDAVCHCVLARGDDVIFDSNQPSGDLEGDIYTHRTTSGVVKSKLNIKCTISVNDFTTKFSPNNSPEFQPNNLDKN